MTPLSSALVEFMLAPAVMEASRQAEEAAKLLLINHPFVLHLQAWLSPGNPDYIFRTSNTSASSTAASVHEGRKGFAMLANASAFWARFPAVVGEQHAATVWSNYRALSPEAFGLLVSKCSTKEQVVWMHYIVCEATACLPSDGARREFVLEMLTALHEAPDMPQGFTFIELLYGASQLRDCLQHVATRMQHTFVGSVLATLRQYLEPRASAAPAASPGAAARGTAQKATSSSSSCLAPMLEFYRNARTRVRPLHHMQPLPRFPMHSTLLQQLYLRHFDDRHFQHLVLGDVFTSDVKAVVEEQLFVLGRQAFPSLCRLLAAKREAAAADSVEASSNTGGASPRRQQFRNRVLLLLSWAFYPFESLQLRDREFGLLCMMAQQPAVQFAETVRRHSSSVSALALFIGAALGMDVPPCLPASVYNNFAVRYQQPRLTEHTLVVGQRAAKGAVWPPQPAHILWRRPTLAIRSFYRPLPAYLLEDLHKQFTSSEAQLRSQHVTFDVHAAGAGPTSAVDVQSGVSVTSLQVPWLRRCGVAVVAYHSV